MWILFLFTKNLFIPKRNVFHARNWSIGKTKEPLFLVNSFQTVPVSMKVCLLSPVPPPYGGIAHWTSLMHRFAQVAGNVDFVQVDTAPRWRSTYDYAVSKRMLGGAIQFIRDYGRFLVA